jgi:hypothetical protein
MNNVEKMGLLLVSITMGVLSVGGQVSAQPETQPAPTIDLEAITCRDLLKMGGEEEENTMLFMHGYMSGKREETMVNAGELAAVTDQVMNTCIDQPSEPLIQVFEQSR